MKIIGFVGISGSGKSYRASEVAAACHIKYIIDDGLLIADGRVVAGKSAKKEDTWLASVKCAIFSDAEHAASVSNAIAEKKPSGILILGTSCEMVHRITQALGIGEAEKFIYIKDIATEEEIERARTIRREQGKHVIPVPTFEIKKDFSGYWLDALKKFTRGAKPDSASNEKSVVRPTYSYMGEFIISNNVLVDMCVYEAENVDGVSRVVGCSVKDTGTGINVKIDIAAEFGVKLQALGRRVISGIVATVEEYTSINVNNVDVRVKTLDLTD